MHLLVNACLMTSLGVPVKWQAPLWCEGHGNGVCGHVSSCFLRSSSGAVSLHAGALMHSNGVPFSLALCRKYSANL